jgi:hypothetical protein
MATEILLNDGGAPARILPFVAGEDVTAGNALTVNTSGEVVNANSGDSTNKFAAIGYALTTITSGNIASVITGHGVVLNVNCADVNAGIAMMMGTTDGRLLTATAAAAGPIAQATTLENNSAAGLTKVITH